MTKAGMQGPFANILRGDSIEVLSGKSLFWHLFALPFLSKNDKSILAIGNMLNIHKTKKHERIAKCDGVMCARVPWIQRAKALERKKQKHVMDLENSSQLRCLGLNSAFPPKPLR